MAYAAYFKDGANVVPFPGSGGGSVSVKTLTSSGMASVLPAGTAFDVPVYAVGSSELQVWIDGLLCVRGEQYNEVSPTAVSFTFDLPADASVTATVTTASGATAFTTSTHTSASRETNIASGELYAVPEYSLGSSMCEIYLDGLQAQIGSAWEEASSTSIRFLTAIPADMEIVAVCRLVS